MYSFALSAKSPAPTSSNLLPTGVLEWGHSSKLARHPGVNRTHQFLRQRLWWPGMAKDVREFPAASSVCSRGRAFSRPPAGLQPLPTPKRPWSHLPVDLGPGLQPSNWNTSMDYSGLPDEDGTLCPSPQTPISSGDGKPVGDPCVPAARTSSRHRL